MTGRLRILLLTALAGMLLLPGVGCSRPGEEKEAVDPTLIVVGDTSLTLSQVTRRIPEGLDPADSAALFSRIVETWLRDELLRDVASENIIDMARIDERTEEYRNNLIINEYIRLMSQSRGEARSEQAVRKYYDAHADEMRLETPLVKGLFIKLPSDADRIDDVRRWVRSASKGSVDNIEKYGLKGAMHYDYFLDKWVDFRELADGIPYHFGKLGEFVSTHRDFETTVNGSTYFLHLTDVKPAGSVMPYDFAAPQIRQALSQKSRSEYAEQLKAQLVNKAREAGTLSTPGYDLKTHKYVNATETGLQR